MELLLLWPQQARWVTSATLPASDRVLHLGCRPKPRSFVWPYFLPRPPPGFANSSKSSQHRKGEDNAKNTHQASTPPKHRPTQPRSPATTRPRFSPPFYPPPRSKGLLTDHPPGETGLCSTRQQAKKKRKKKRRKCPKAPPRPLKQNEGQGRAGGSPSLPPFIAAEPSDWLPLFAAGYALSKILYYCVGRPGDSLFFP